MDFSKNYSTIDFFYYLMPGATVALSFLAVYRNTIAQWHIPEWLGIILFLFAAYLLGHVLQGIGKFMESAFYHKGMPSAGLLDDKNNHLGEDTKRAVKEKIKKTVGFIPANGKEAFEVCHAFVSNHMPRARSLSFLNLYGFYRGLAAAFLVVSIMAWFSAFAVGGQIWISAAFFSAVTVYLFWRSHYYSKKFGKTIFFDLLTITNTTNEHE